jgi:DNA-directed RNA polymerase sigma subunit (sigma70/sigma32)
MPLSPDGKTLSHGYWTVEDFQEDDLGALAEREREVIRLAFGLPDGEPQNLRQIGERFGVSSERVRQIRNEGLSKLVGVSARRRVETESGS